MNKFFWGIIFAALLPTTAIFGTLYEAQELVNSQGQEIIILGDCHEYSNEVKPSSRARVEDITTQQRNEILTLAKQRNAVILVEDMTTASTTSYPTIRGLPTMITLAMDRYFECYHYQVITNLVPLCQQHNVEAHSIECRHAAVILKTPPPYLPTITNYLTTIAPVIPICTQMLSTCVSTLIHPTTIMALGACIATLAAKLYPAGIIKTVIDAHQAQENSAIVERAKQLHTAPLINKLIAELEKFLKESPADAINNMVDLNILNVIKEQPEKKSIIICAGAWHTKNIATFLKQLGYTAKPVQEEFMMPEAILINGSHDYIKPLAISKTFGVNILQEA